MKIRRHNVIPKVLNNKGFSLIELIISITILVLIMVPLMNNFIRSMQMNKKAEDIQVQSNLSASIMEGLKNLNMEDTIDQFTGVDPFDIIKITPLVEEIKVLRYIVSTGLYEEVLPAEYLSLDGQATYYFAINGIRDGSSAYDALIKMDAADLRATSNILNDYPMPDAINIDGLSNGLLLSNGEKAADDIDQDALDTYILWGKAYASNLFSHSTQYLDYIVEYDKWKNDYEIAEMNGSTLPTAPTLVDYISLYPEYCDPATVQTHITKSVKIVINQDLTNKVTYQVDYSCAWPSGCDLESIIQNPVSEKSYEVPLENIYLFFKPSIFMNSRATNPDIISIDNQTTDKAVNFYVANQEGATLTQNLTLLKAENDGVSIFTNLFNPLDPLISYINLNFGVINPRIVKAETKDRIYEVDIKIYEYVDTTNFADKYKKELYNLSSTREQ